MATASKMRPAGVAGRRGPKRHEFASPDRLTREETIDKLKEIQSCLLKRASNVIDDETDRLQISELCRRDLKTVVGAPHHSSLITSFQKAVALADRQYAGDLWDAEMKSSGEAMASAGRIPTCEQVTVIQRQLHAWRELSAEAIRAWAPKFFAIACRFEDQISQAPSEWAKAKLLDGVNRKLRPAQFGALTFWLRAACGERDKEPEDSLIPWKMPTWFVAQQVAPVQVVEAAIPLPTSESSPKEVLNFIPKGDDQTVAEAGFSNVALFNTYELIVPTLRMVKTVIAQKDGGITAGMLRDLFPNDDLYHWAGLNDWSQFIDDFRPLPKQSVRHAAHPGLRPLTPERSAVLFLHRTTGLRPGTIEKIVSQVRTSKENPKRRKKPAKATG